MKTLISVYTAVIGTIKLKGDRRLKKWLNDVEANHPSLSYFVKKRIITDNLYQLPVPRLTKNDRFFNEIVERATPEFDELAQEVGAHGCAPLLFKTDSEH